MGEPRASESGWKVPLDQSMAKLPLTAPEPKAVLLERCLARADRPQRRMTSLFPSQEVPSCTPGAGSFSTWVSGSLPGPFTARILKAQFVSADEAH
jgi:hypothetical protein